MRREICLIAGKEIFDTKEEARANVRSFRRKHAGRGKAYACSWGEHYHVTKGLRGRKGKEHRK